MYEGTLTHSQTVKASVHFRKLVVATAVTQALSQGTEKRMVGRTRVDVNLDDVEFLQSLCLGLTKIGLILGVSRSNRMVQC